MSDSGNIVDAYSIESSIKLLKQHLGHEDIGPLLAVMEALVDDPKNEALLDQLSHIFSGLGVLQGAVLTYAPCITIMVTDNPLDDVD